MEGEFDSFGEDVAAYLGVVAGQVVKYVHHSEDLSEDGEDKGKECQGADVTEDDFCFPGVAVIFVEEIDSCNY